jgi:hypothetical protein
MIVERVLTPYTKPPPETLAEEYADALDEMRLLHDGVALAEAADSVISRLPYGPGPSSQVQRRDWHLPQLAPRCVQTGRIGSGFGSERAPLRLDMPQSSSSLSMADGAGETESSVHTLRRGSSSAPP